MPGGGPKWGIPKSNEVHSVSSPDESPAGHRARGGTWWSAAVQWRNWPLLVKLGMVLVVPVVGALVLGVLRVRADVDLAESYAGIERVATVRVELVRVMSAVQQERNLAIGDGTGLDKAVVATDDAVERMSDLVRAAGEDGTTIRGYDELSRALDGLPSVRRSRDLINDGLFVLTGYNAVTSAVLEFDRSLTGRFPDATLTNFSIALGELQAVREQVALQQAAGILAMRDPSRSDVVRQLTVEADVRLDDQLGDFRSVAPEALRERYDSTVAGTDVTTRQQLVDAVRTVGPTQAGVTLDQWNAVSDATTGLLSQVTQGAASDLRSGSVALAESVSNRAGLESVLLMAMVLLAGGIGGGLGRYLVRSFAVLRRAALDVADTRLPAAVASIRAGEPVQTAMEPVPLTSTEEFGQLARAFDAVHEQALKSAVEEAGLRNNLANIFTNLSRRSQSLVERQLRLMEQLEEKTDDPDQLANLFKIDHLAARMRRNNENLMVLSGTGFLRRFPEAVPLADVLRAAISEIEHYERAVVRSSSQVRVAGYAAGDLIRSVSELIENATAFSPPDSSVVVASRLRPDGAVVLDVLDEGVGMGAAELREANHRVAGGGGVDVPISRQMGLFVVGRLTARHGIQVRLAPRHDGGLCASVLVPATLLTVDEPSTPALTPALAPVPAPVVTPAPALAAAPVTVSAPVMVAAGGVPSPGDVAGRLESAGISVRLPELPAARTPASILFAASTPVADDAENATAATAAQVVASSTAESTAVLPAVSGFSWLTNKPGADAAPAARAATPAPVSGPGGLPKRVPKGQLSAALRQASAPVATQPRDAARARGFLSGFQAGIRQSEQRRGETES